MSLTQEQLELLTQANTINTFTLESGSDQNTLEGKLYEIAVSLSQINYDLNNVVVLVVIDPLTE